MTTDTNPTPEEQYVKREYEDDDEPESLFYVEKATGFIYEVKLFADFALVRPAAPDYASAVQKISLLDFSKHFDEYLGNYKTIRDFLWGHDMESIGVEKK